MTVRVYFMQHPNLTAGDDSIRPLFGADDALLYAGVPIDAGVFKLIKAGRYDEQIPAASMVRLRTLGGFCG